MISYRLGLAAAGGLAGAALWALIHYLPMDGAVHLQLAIVAAVTILSGSGLLLAGPVRPLRAIGWAVGLAVLGAALLGWAGLRYDDPFGAHDFAVSILAAVGLVFLALPFVVAHERAYWRAYPALFDACWSLVVRISAGVLFVLVFEIALLLSSALLEIVGLDLWGFLTAHEITLFVLNGAVLGVALAVLHEMEDYVSPVLLLRLLRLLEPMLAVILIVFLGALVPRGLSDLFGDYSAAMILGATALAAIILVGATLDRDDHEALASGRMYVARLLAGLLPVVAGLALWAVVLRVRQYGLTPDRLAALTATGVLCVYGLAYGAIALTSGQRWMGRIRRANVLLAAGVMAVLVLWLTPVLDATRLSTNSQVARLIAGATDDVAILWPMANRWGRAGQRGIATLTEAVSEDTPPALIDGLARVDADSQYDFDRALDQPVLADRAVALHRMITAVPPAPPLETALFSHLHGYQMDLFQEACARADTCFALTAGGQITDDALVLWLDSAHQIEVWGLNAGAPAIRYPALIQVTGTFDLGAALMAQQFKIAPRSGHSLYLGGAEVPLEN